MAKTVRASYRFSLETDQQLRELADEDKRSMASMIAVLVAREHARRQVYHAVLNGTLPGQPKEENDAGLVVVPDDRSGDDHLPGVDQA